MAEKKKVIKVTVEGETSEDNERPMNDDSVNIRVDIRWFRDMLNAMEKKKLNTIEISINGDPFSGGDYNVEIK